LTARRGNHRFSARGAIATAIAVVAAFCAAAGAGALWSPRYRPVATERGDLGVRRDDAPDLCIVLLLIDTLRADRLSCYGYGRKTTPNIDALASESLLLGNNKSQSGMTVISMASMFQSRYTTSTSLPPGRGQDGATLAEVLQSAGYRTLGVQTNPGVNRRRGYGRGFDKYTMLLPEGETGVLTGTGWTAEVKRNVFYVEAEEIARTCEEILSTADEGPLFLFAHFMDVHGPYIPHEEFQVFGGRVYGLSEAIALSGDWVGRARGGDPADALPLKTDVEALFDGEILQADAAVGRILDALRKAGVYDNSFVIVASDHGEGFLEHGRVLHANSLYEELVHTPLIMKIPGRGPGRYDGLTRNVDIAPTIFEVAGVDAVWEDRDGVSLLKVIDEGYRIRESVGRIRVKMGDGIGLFGSLQAATTKYIASETPWQSFREELYDLATDRAEVHDLAESERSTVRALAEALATRGGADSAREDIEYDAETAAALRALGYLQ
jgi:arylsulfatase